MVKMLRCAAIAGVACSVCALALGAMLLRTDMARYPAPAAASGPDAASGATTYGQGGGAETAGSDAVRAIDPALFSSSVTRLTPADVDGALLTTQGVHNDVAARDVCANLAKANVLVGIYMDSGEPWNAGCLTGYDQDRPFSAENQRLATLLQDDVLGAMNAQGWDIPDEGVQPDTGLGSALTAAAEAYDHLLLLGPAKAGYFSTPSQMPGALIEPLFVTDPFEASIAVSTHGQQVIASALAEAIEQYFTGVSR